MHTSLLLIIEDLATLVGQQRQTKSDMTWRPSTVGPKKGARTQISTYGAIPSEQGCHQYLLLTSVKLVTVLQGLFLESPFNNLLDEVELHPFGSPWWIIPGYSSLIRYAFKEGAEYFQSDESIDKITCPILILHAKDDIVVPYRLGKQLYDVAQEKRPKEAPSIKFVSFESERQFGHKYIVNAPELSDIISNFIKK